MVAVWHQCCRSVDAKIRNPKLHIRIQQAITDLNRSGSYKDIFYHQYENSGRKKGSFLLVNTVRSPLIGKENEAGLFFCSVIC